MREADRAGVQLACVAAVAETRHGLVRLIQRVGEACARREVVPSERSVVTREVQPRYDGRETGVRQRRARERLAPLTVVANTRVDRHAATRVGVADVKIE